MTTDYESKKLFTYDLSPFFSFSSIRLENALRNFSTLTQGDNIEISYNDKIYGILVMEIKPPGVGISIVETDLEVDFAPPVGYQEPTPQPRSRPIMVKAPFCFEDPGMT